MKITVKQLKQLIREQVKEIRKRGPAHVELDLPAVSLPSRATSSRRNVELDNQAVLDAGINRRVKEIFDTVYNDNKQEEEKVIEMLPRRPLGAMGARGIYSLVSDNVKPEERSIRSGEQLRVVGNDVERRKISNKKILIDRVIELVADDTGNDKDTVETKAKELRIRSDFQFPSFPLSLGELNTIYATLVDSLAQE